MNNAIVGLLAVVVAVLLLVWWPLAIIWSLNTLFGLNIPSNLSTWFAVVLLASVVRATTICSKKD